MIRKHVLSFLGQPACGVDHLHRLASVLSSSITSLVSAVASEHFRGTMLQSRTITTGPHLTIKPEGQLLIDDKLQLKISGLGKQQKTTVHAVINEGSAVFESCCCYTADDSGEVNLATQPSQAGSYTGEIHINL